MRNLNKLREVTREELENIKIDGPIGVKGNYDFEELLKNFKELGKKAKSYSEYLQKKTEVTKHDDSESIYKKEVDDLQNKIFNNIKGMEGENKIKYYLSRIDMKMIILHNLRFVYKEDEENACTTQIDFIVITEGGVFILESKSWSGTIILKENDSFFVIKEQEKWQPKSHMNR